LVVVDDYLAILTPLVEQCPDILFLSQAFPTAFNILVGALTLLNTDTTFRALGIIRAILGHDSLSPSQVLQVPPKFPLYAKVISEVIEKDGPMLVHNLFAGLMEHFAPEMMSGVITTVRILTQLWTASMQQWVQTVLEQMSVPPALEQARTQFILDFNAYARSFVILWFQYLISTSTGHLLLVISIGSNLLFQISSEACYAPKTGVVLWTVNHRDKSFYYYKMVFI
jgi:hypothetical protein